MAPWSIATHKREGRQHRPQKGVSSQEVISRASALPALLLLPSIMKVLVAVLLVLLCTMTLCFQETKNVHDTSDTSNTPITCCFVYTSRQIPRKLVNDYYLTSSLCLQPAVVFQTKKGRKICADPKTTWVKEYIAELELEA